MAFPERQPNDISLAQAYAQAKAAEPRARARDIADGLGVTEGVLAEARAGEGVRRLGLRGASFAGMLPDLAQAGPVISLTCNDTAVHETTGEIGEVSHSGAVGQITGAIDLRLFFRHWHVGYAVEEETRSGLRHSIQVFDTIGTAVLKVYAVGDTDLAVWHRIVAQYVDPSSQLAAFSLMAAPAAEPPDAEIDVAALREGWRALEHSHDFHRLLRTVGAGREQALRLAGEDLARRVEPLMVRRLLDGAAAARLPIMCFVGNEGCLQIFSGRVRNIAPRGPWLNVLDPGFNLHLRTDRVASAWVVVKPTALRGPITSLELFDARHRLICQFFGARPPGEGERAAWRELVSLAERRAP